MRMMKSIAVQMTIVLTCSVPVYGQSENESPKFDGVRARQYVTYLSGDSMQGRESCTDGFRKAADWVATQFKEWGLSPAGVDGTYFQDVEIRPFDWKTGIPTLQIGARDFPRDDGDFSVHSGSTADTTFQGEVVFVGYLQLIDRGWGHNEICGSRDHFGLMGGATLRTLGKKE